MSRPITPLEALTVDVPDKLVDAINAKLMAGQQDFAEEELGNSARLSVIVAYQSAGWHITEHMDVYRFTPAAEAVDSLRTSLRSAIQL